MNHLGLNENQFTTKHCIFILSDKMLHNRTVYISIKTMKVLFLRCVFEGSVSEMKWCKAGKMTFRVSSYVTEITECHVCLSLCISGNRTIHSHRTCRLASTVVFVSAV